MFKKLKNNKAFTMIEIITVLAIITILVAIAMPNVLGYRNKSDTIAIKDNIAVMENKVMEVIIRDKSMLTIWPKADMAELNDRIDRGKVYSSEGLLREIEPCEYRMVPFTIDDDIDYLLGVSQENKKKENNKKGVYYTKKNGEVLFSIEGEISRETIDTDELKKLVSMLKDLIEEAEALEDDGNEYTNSKAWDKEIAKALAMLGMDNLSPNMLYMSIMSVSSCLDNLIIRTDKNKLAEIIKKAQKIEIEHEEYIDTGLEDFKLELNKAIKIRHDASVTQKGIDIAVRRVQDSMDNLKYKTYKDMFRWREDDEFGYEAINEKNKGYYQYRGSSKEVTIPHIINGTLITSYYKMFENSEVKKVNSTNKNITDMSFMFRRHDKSRLNLSNFDTSNVTSMYGMFLDTEIDRLDLRSFDTSNVIDMNSMFKGNESDYIDLSSFNTSNVIDMAYMFYKNESKSLDLTSFDTSKVLYMNNMFNGNEAKTVDLSSFNILNVIDIDRIFRSSEIEIVYARTQSDIDKFNTTSIPSDLRFRFK